VPSVLKFTFLPARSATLRISGRAKTWSSEGKRLTRLTTRLRMPGISARNLSSASVLMIAASTPRW
jgi:hypothetical protein